MIKDLLHLIDHVTRHNGPTPLEIICNRRTLRMLVKEDLEHRVDRLIEILCDASPLATYRFCGIPINVVHEEVIEDGKFAVIPQRQYTMEWPIAIEYNDESLIGKYKTDTGDRFWEFHKSLIGKYKTDTADGFWEFRPYEAEDYERLHDLAVANIRKKEEPQDIDDAKLLSILNGGGFNAVA